MGITSACFVLPFLLCREELRAATRDWSKSRQLGSGSYGAVFKGEMEAMKGILAVFKAGIEAGKASQLAS